MVRFTGTTDQQLQQLADHLADRVLTLEREVHADRLLLHQLITILLLQHVVEKDEWQGMLRDLEKRVRLRGHGSAEDLHKMLEIVKSFQADDRPAFEVISGGKAP